MRGPRRSRGVFSFLTKPVDKDALYKAIDSALEHAAPSGDDAWRESIVTRSPCDAAPAGTGADGGAIRR